MIFAYRDTEPRGTNGGGTPNRCGDLERAMLRRGKLNPLQDHCEQLERP